MNENGSAMSKLTSTNVGSLIRQTLSAKDEAKRLSAEKRELKRIETLSAEAALKASAELAEYDKAALLRLEEERVKEEAALSAALDRIETTVPPVKGTKVKKGVKALAPVPAVEVDEIADLTEVVEIARLSVEKAGLAQTAAHLALSALGKRASKTARAAAQSEVDKAEQFNKEQREFLATAEDELAALLAPPAPAVKVEEVPAVKVGQKGSKDNPCIILTDKGVPCPSSVAGAKALEAKYFPEKGTFFTVKVERTVAVKATAAKPAVKVGNKPAVKVGLDLVVLQMWDGKVTEQSQFFLDSLLAKGKVEGVDFRIEHRKVFMKPAPFVAAPLSNGKKAHNPVRQVLNGVKTVAPAVEVKDLIKSPELAAAQILLAEEKAIQELEALVVAAEAKAKAKVEFDAKVAQLTTAKAAVLAVKRAELEARLKAAQA